MDITTRISLLIIFIMLSLVITANVAVFAETRHSRELSNIARSEAEKRYIIEWWLNSTSISGIYNVSKIEDITPDKAGNILNEYIYGSDMGLFIGGVQFRFLKYLNTGTEYVTPGDVTRVFKSILNTRNMTPSCENVLGKMFFHMTAGSKRSPGACKYTINDMDRAVSLILEIAISHNISSEYLSSIIAKFYILRIAINSGIYRETYEKILDELLMKESMLLAFMFKSMANDLGVKIVEEVDIEDILKPVDRSGTSVVSDIDLNLLFKTLIDLSREIRDRKLDLNVLSMVIEMVFKEGLDLSSIEKLVSMIREIEDNDSLVVAISSVFKRETEIQAGAIAHDNSTTITGVYTGSSTSIVDYRRVYEERYGGGMFIDQEKSLLNAINNKDVSDNVGSPGSVSSDDSILELENEFQRLLEKINKESLSLNIIRVNKDYSSSEKGLHAQPPRVLTNRVMEMYRYIPLILGLLITTSYFLIYARQNLLHLAKYLIRFLKRTLSPTISQQRGTRLTMASFDKRALFLIKFWGIIIKLSSRHGVEISVSTTHREAYKLLVASDIDAKTSYMLWELVLGYEKVRYSGVSRDIDIDSLMNIAESL